MADLEMPQRQTYPHIIGEVKDAVGLLPLVDAEALTLLVQIGPAGDLFILDAEVPGSPQTFVDEDGVEHTVSFVAPIGASGISDDVTTDDMEAKLKITWETGPPELVQFAPKTGFLKIAITRNVQAEP